MPTIQINFSDNTNDYFTLTDGDSSYQWHGRKGVVQNPDTVLMLIKARQYPAAEIIVTPATDDTPAVTKKPNSLQEWEAWQAENPDVEPLPWVSTHPVDEGILKRSLISESTRQELKALRQSNPELVPLIDILAGRNA